MPKRRRLASLLVLTLAAACSRTSVPLSSPSVLANDGAMTADPRRTPEPQSLRAHVPTAPTPKCDVITPKPGSPALSANADPRYAVLEVLHLLEAGRYKDAESAAGRLRPQLPNMARFLSQQALMGRNGRARRHDRQEWQFVAECVRLASPAKLLGDELLVEIGTTSQTMGSEVVMPEPLQLLPEGRERQEGGPPVPDESPGNPRR